MLSNVQKLVNKNIHFVLFYRIIVIPQKLTFILMPVNKANKTFSTKFKFPTNRLFVRFLSNTLSEVVCNSKTLAENNKLKKNKHTIPDKKSKRVRINV